MSELPPDAWVPVPLRWRHVAVGDVFVAPNGRLWTVAHAGVGSQTGQFGVVVENGNAAQRWHGKVDPDETINVLVPVTERDAVELCREELGARLVTGRTD